MIISILSNGGDPHHISTVGRNQELYRGYQANELNMFIILFPIIFIAE